MAAFAEFLKAVAALLWPLFAFVLLFMYRKELRHLITRLRRGKLLGQEIELAESLDKLNESADSVAAEVPAQAPADERTTKQGVTPEAAVVDRVLETAAQSPKAALILLAAEIERELRQLIATLGLLRGRRNLPFSQALGALSEWGGLPKHLPGSVTLFWDVRNRLVHGHDATDDEIIRAIDSGIVILRSLQAIPHETYVVLHAGVPIFADPQCTKRIDGATAVFLETHSPGGAAKTVRVFPTTRDHFVVGKRVAWEWSDARVFPQAWYREPDTGEIGTAWRSSMEFVGRHLDEV